jgi:hypothetical protein
MGLAVTIIISGTGLHPGTCCANTGVAATVNPKAASRRCLKGTDFFVMTTPFLEGRFHGAIAQMYPVYTKNGTKPIGYVVYP